MHQRLKVDCAAPTRSCVPHGTLDIILLLLLLMDYSAKASPLKVLGAVPRSLLFCWFLGFLEI